MATGDQRDQRIVQNLRLTHDDAGNLRPQLVEVFAKVIQLLFQLVISAHIKTCQWMKLRSGPALAGESDRGFAENQSYN